jgi:putative DNA methylase
METLIESPHFPVDIVNQAAAKEKQGGGRPEFWEMVFWWTRKPLASARAVLAAAALPADAKVSTFVSQVLRARVNMKNEVENVPHRENPSPPPEWRERFAKMKVLDPFAGFGSIPLEAVRLGFGEVVAVELLPTAYVFLKAVLEYPKWAVEKGLGQRLVKDVERWGRWVAEQPAQDPDIKELYDPDVAVYIGTWEVKCPHCGKYTPLIGNWWLARVSKTKAEEEEGEEEEEEEGARSGLFSRLAWMDWENGSVKVVDLNRELKAKLIKAKVNARQGYVEVGGRKYNVRRPNIDARREAATCLYCGNQIRYYLPKLSRHSVEKPKNVEAVWYVKHALREWNRLLEEYLSGRIELEKLLESPARPTLLAKVKVKEGDLEFEPATNQDIRKLWNALEKLRLMWSDPDIPIELFAPYQMGTAGAFRITLWGFDKWFKLFNPRQLLTLVKLVKLIREAGKKVEEEKLREGWSEEDAFKYAEAITAYLAIALARFVDHNNLVTLLHPSNPMGIEVAHALSMRGLAMQWNWGDTNLFLTTKGLLRINSWIKCLEKELEALSYLVPSISTSRSKIKVWLDDAMVLSSLRDEKYDIILTDPPYRDDVPYVELSDLYYVWLKRALSNVSDGKLAPRFLSEAFFKRVGAAYREIRTQWEELAPREVGLNVGRLSYFKGQEASEEEARRYFIDLLHRSFVSMRRLLKDDGLLVTYYAHTDPEAWEELISAGWRAGFRVTAAFPVATESAQRVTARGKAALDTSIVVVWRPGVKGEELRDQVYREALASAEERALELLRAGRSGVDLFVGTLAATLSAVTSKEKIVGVDDVGVFVRERAYPAAARGLARAISRYVGGGEAGEEVGDAGALFYMLAKILLPRSSRAGRRVMDRSTVHIIGFGTGLDDKELDKLKVVEKRGEAFHLLEPRGDSKDDLVELMRERGLDPARPQLRSAVDALHLLEYYAVTLDVRSFRERLDGLRSLNAVLVEEALRLARVLGGRLLPLNDPERALCQRVTSYATGAGTLEGWLHGA